MCVCVCILTRKGKNERGKRMKDENDCFSMWVYIKKIWFSYFCVCVCMYFLYFFFFFFFVDILKDW